MPTPGKRSLATTLRHLGREIAREARAVPEGASRSEVLGTRARRSLRLLAQDLRGLPVRAIESARLRAEIAALLPWPAAEHEERLLAGHLPAIPEAPLVSVIVPVYGKLDYTIRCLLSIGACRERSAFEVIVVDDCSPDATEATLSRCPGIRYLRNETNGGFITSCNRGAAEARGRFLHFLNNDTVVLPGWLDRLVETIEAIPDAGLVGSRLIYPSLALQESGGIVWRDGSATNWGNGRDPFNPTYGYLRDADYCSAASALVPRDLFERIGGFDPRYAPAYYEDTDLAFRIREAGARVLVQPASRIVHHEGATSGTDEAVGPKRHQAINRQKFLERWRDVLATHGHYGETGPRELDRRSTRSVLLIDAKTPRPDQDSGSVDLVNMLQVLRDMRCRVTFLPALAIPRGLPVPDVQAADGPYTEALQRAGVECLHFPYEPSVERFLRERGADFDVVVLTRARIADRFLAAVRRHCPRAKIVFNTTDLSYLREEREAAHVGSRLRAWKARDTKRRELGAAARADATIVLSRHEADLLAREVPGASVKIVPLIREIPGRGAPLAGRAGVLFVGGFRHRPNLDAVSFLVREIWPQVRALLPGVHLHVVGSATPPEVFALATDDVEVHGHVADLGAMLARVRVSVAPLRFGAGLKGKIAESLGHGVPCVTTGIGVEGSGLTHGRDVLVADDAAGIAAEIARSHRDDALWERLSSEGLAFVRREYSIDATRRRLEELFDALRVPATPR